VVDSPREKRGMRYLPTVTGRLRRREPHRLPLDDRLRGLLLRKLERARSPRKPLDHPIDLSPPVGAPAPEAEESLQASDAAKRAGEGAIRHSGDPTARGLRQRLRQLAEREGSARPMPAKTEASEPAVASPVRSSAAADSAVPQAHHVPRPASPGRAFIPAGTPRVSLDAVPGLGAGRGVGLPRQAPAARRGRRPPGRGTPEQGRPAPATGTPAEPADAAASPGAVSAETVIQAGDALARLARRRRSRDQKRDEGKVGP